MKLLHTLALLVFALPLALSSAQAGEPAKGAEKEPPPVPEKKEPPRRPFPALQQVIWYEDFESEKLPPYMEQAKNSENPVPQMKTNTCCELAEQDRNNKTRWVVVKPLQVAAKFPDGTAPNQIGFFMNVWIEETGTIKLKCFHKGGDYEDNFTVSKEKQWVPVQFKLADLRNKANRAEADNLIEKMEIFYVPREKKEFKKAYIDDLLITTGVPKSDVLLPAVQKARQQITGMIRTMAKDGYAFNQANQEILKRALKPAAGPAKRRNKSILAFGARPEDSAELVKSLTAGAAKQKLTGYSIVPAEVPEMGPAGGLDDSRAFLVSNIVRTEAEFVLLMLSAQDGKVPGRPADNVRLAIDRALEQGTIPIVVLPPVIPGLSDKEKKDIDSFVTSVTNICSGKGISLIDTAFAVKSATNPMDGAELSAAGIEAVAGVATAAIKHIETNVITAKR